MKQKYLGFSLSEVLITLGVIGVVAAITLPVVIQKQNNNANAIKLQKIYNTLTQVHLLAIQENGDVNRCNITNDIQASTPNIFFYYEPYLKLTKKCYNSPGCWATNTKSLSGQKALWSGDRRIGLDDYYICFKFMDGVNVSFNIYKHNYSFFGLPDLKTPFVVFYIDLNGDKSPNVFGKDIFGFAVDSKKGILPFGINDESASCTKNLNTQTAGFGCAYKVLQEKTINY